MSTELTAGAQVWYTPHQDHHLAFDRDGQFLFHFHHLTDGPRHRKGDPLDLLASLNQAVLLVGSRPLLTRDQEGRLISPQGHPFTHGRPKKPWRATVVRVNADGTCDLDIEHPLGGITLHVPDRGAHPNAPGVKYDPTAKDFHTFHCPGE